MGRFVVTHTAAGDRFILQGEGGRTLAVSRYYANLDACKKGMRSLLRFAPSAPVVDVGAGEYADNPKFALYGGETWRFELLAANGKCVIASPEYATKKACLRAISMLRTGTKNAEAVLSEPAGFKPLTVAPVTAAERSEKPAKTRKAAPVGALNKEKTAGPAAVGTPVETPAAPVARPAVPKPAPAGKPATADKPAAGTPHGTVPRLIRLTPAAPAKPQPKPAAPAAQDKKQGWLERLLKRQEKD